MLSRGELTGRQRRAVAAIVRGRKAWMDEERLNKAGHRNRTLATLVAAGWLARWALPDGAAFTLTPWAAEQLKVETRDYWEYVASREPPPKEETPPARGGLAVVNGHGNGDGNGIARSCDTIRVENLVEVPRWVPVPPPRLPGDPAPPRVNVFLPKRHHQCRLPDWLMSTWIGPDYDPVAEVEEAEEFLMSEIRSEEGDILRDEHGLPKMERLKVFGIEVPIAKLRGKKHNT